MTPNDLHTCALCGYQFDASSMACHASCPMSTGCHLICCPNCGYQVPDEKHMSLTAVLRRAWDGRHQKSQEVRS